MAAGAEDGSGWPRYNRETFPYDQVRWRDALGRKYVFDEDWEDPEWLDGVERGVLQAHVALPSSFQPFPEPGADLVLGLGPDVAPAALREQLAVRIMTRIRVSLKTGGVGATNKYLAALLPAEPLDKVYVTVKNVTIIPPLAARELGEVNYGPEHKRVRPASFGSTVVARCALELAPRSRGVSTLTYLVSPEQLVSFIDPVRVEQHVSVKLQGAKPQPPLPASQAEPAKPEPGSTPLPGKPAKPPGRAMNVTVMPPLKTPPPPPRKAPPRKLPPPPSPLGSEEEE